MKKEMKFIEVVQKIKKNQTKNDGSVPVNYVGAPLRHSFFHQNRSMRSKND